MKLKLSKSQFFQIYTILQCDIAAANPTEMAAIVIHSVMMGIVQKFYRKAFNRNRRKYTLTLTRAECCAWWLFFQQYPFTPDQLYEQTIIQSINNSIHKEHI